MPTTFEDEDVILYLLRRRRVTDAGEEHVITRTTFRNRITTTAVVTVRVDGTMRRRMTDESLRPIRVNWLPDSRLVFLAYVVPTQPQPPGDPRPPPELFVVNPDGTGLRQLTRDGAYVDPVRRPLFVSPDGQCVAHRVSCRARSPMRSALPASTEPRRSPSASRSVTSGMRGSCGPNTGTRVC